MATEFLGIQVIAPTSMKIRSKISLYFAPFILVVVIAIFVLNYTFVRKGLTENALLELARVEQNMHRAAQSLLSAAIANYLRGITEKNLDFIEEQYALYRLGRLTEAEAKGNIQMHFDIQAVGDSGYLVAVREAGNNLYLDLHPYLPKQNCSDTEGCQVWSEVRHGYLEYNWKNPADNTYRKKAAYVEEFPQWNWIVGASSYRDEFIDLIKVDDLRNLLAPVTINNSGYFFVFDENRTILIHPEFENSRGDELINSQGENVLQLLLDSEDGYVTYLWKNPSEKIEKRKYAFIEKLEDYDWYLVATGYLDEVYEPIGYLKKLTIFIVLLATGAMLLIIFKLSRSISIPLLQLERGVNDFYEKKNLFNWRLHKIDEIDILGKAFSRMTAELNRSMLDLQQKNNELEISEREKEQNRILLDGIINSMPSVIIGVTPQFTITQLNSRAERLSGKTLNEILEQSLFTAFPEIFEHREILKDSITNNQVRSLHYTSTDQNGQAHYSELTIYPLVTAGNEGAVIRIDEVTDRVEMEQRLRQSQKMDAIGQLAGGIAHDFNNMLSGIVGAAELLYIKVPPEDQQLVRIIREASGRAGELIQKLLAFSRKESVAFIPVDMHTILQDTIEILQRTLDKRISISSELNAEHTQIRGDWSQLQNSLLNIGINAGHAMVEGGNLTFTTSSITLDQVYCSTSSFDLEPGEFLHIGIRDTGCGIAKEHLKKVFEPFFTTREQSKGTGLGLAAVYGTIQQHNGAISVYSELGIGTEFSIILPLSEEKVHIDSRPRDIVPGEGCILIIDDEPVIRTTARLMLEKLGYTVLEAENGEEGVAVFLQHMNNIDLILLDMLMPVMDGTECFYQLKAIDKGVRIIISSGFTRDADLSVLKREGLCSFVRKPYNMIDLSEAIALALKNT